jgi:polyhydroxyalkanoate synthesis regulator protein
VTSQTLTQIILDEGRRGTSFLPSELLHDLVRVGERAMNNGLEQVQHGVDRLVQASIDRLAPVRRAREEMSGLRSRLEQLETSLAELEKEGVAEGAPRPAKASSETTIIRPNGRQEKS